MPPRKRRAGARGDVQGFGTFGEGENGPSEKEPLRPSTKAGVPVRHTEASGGALVARGGNELVGDLETVGEGEYAPMRYVEGVVQDVADDEEERW